jgi:hypothetical protein
MENHYTQNEVIDIIADIVEDYSVSLEYMLRKAHTESKFNPSARNRSGAAGLYQIMPFNTEREREDNPDFDPYDPHDATDWTCRFTKRNAAALEKAGVDVEDWLLYLAHQQGAGGLQAILQGARRGLTISELSGTMRRNITANIRSSQRGRIRTCQQFLDDWRQYYEKIKLTDYAKAKIDELE